jgi:hypothetical protein
MGRFRAKFSEAVASMMWEIDPCRLVRQVNQFGS